MLILGSFGLSSKVNRQKLTELLPDRKGKMLIIPLASPYEAETGRKEKVYAAEAGFDPESIFIFDSSKPDALPGMRFDYISVPGGNTFKLLHLVKKFALDGFIRQQVAAGAVYLGFSAGAYLACPDVWYVHNFDDNNHITNGDFTALGLTDKYFLCHYDRRGIEEIMMCRRDLGFGPELITIKDEQLIVLGEAQNG
ncbi:MAG: Type 1 glutamine amidotransferase-like domain-containing protein [Ruminococcus sp.]|nr:Type 1 glutamine amidotransferase-like domain-containing protein [Ruminococcus sp.]